MTKSYVLWHLREAEEELTGMIRALESGPEYGPEEFEIAMKHLYHHINSSWNARDVPQDRAEACSEGDFFAWRRFPDDTDMSF